MSPRTQTIVKVLRAAARIVNKGWTQGTFARDAQNRYVEYDSPEAVKFCMSGALSRAALELKVSCDYDGAVRAIRSSSPIRRGLPGYNDDVSRTKTQVSRALHRAARYLIARG